MGLVTTSTLSFAAKGLSDEEVKTAMQKPLIVGASISADFGASSPGKRLALRFTEASQIKTIAFGGQPGRDTVATVKPEDFKQRTSILAIDLFFWDSVFGDTAGGKKAIQKIVHEAKSLGIPLVLGEIPELIPGRQSGRAVLNQAIHQACQEYDKCFVLPLIELHKRVIQDRYLLIQGTKYTFQQLVPDGLHINSKASDYIADMMQYLLQGKKILINK